MSVFGDTVSIKCFTYGKNIYIRNGDSSDLVSARAYVVAEPVKGKDILDGQVVKSVSPYPVNFKPGVTLYEALTWND